MLRGAYDAAVALDNDDDDEAGDASPSSAPPPPPPPRVGFVARRSIRCGDCAGSVGWGEQARCVCWRVQASAVRRAIGPVRATTRHTSRAAPSNRTVPFKNKELFPSFLQYRRRTELRNVWFDRFRTQRTQCARVRHSSELRDFGFDRSRRWWRTCAIASTRTPALPSAPMKRPGALGCAAIRSPIAATIAHGATTSTAETSPARSSRPSASCAPARQATMRGATRHAPRCRFL